MGTLYISATARICLRWAGENTLPQGLDGELTTIAAVFSSMRDSMCRRSTSQSLSGRRLYSRVSISKPAESVVYRGNPGRGTRIFCPAFAIVEMAMSRAHEQPEHRMMSLAVTSPPGTETCSATASLEDTNPVLGP